VELGSRTGQPLFLLKSARGIFDCQQIPLFSLASVRALAAEASCTIDPRRFRANIYMAPVSGNPFEEETWTDCLLQIGDEVLTGVTQRDARCMMINLDGNRGPEPAGAEGCSSQPSGPSGSLCQRAPTGSNPIGRCHPSNCKPSIVNAVLIADVVKSQYERDQR